MKKIVFTVVQFVLSWKSKDALEMEYLTEGCH